ncbi:MAG: Lrp/AsnC family transcriptional regulator [Candidatus Diapherotrites archaeon]
MTLDSTDKDILNAILWDAKSSLQQVAKKLHIPLSTLHHRIKRFEELKVITRYEAKIDYSKIGRPIEAFVLVEAMNVLPSGKKIYQQDLLEELRKIESVEEGYIITGTADLMARVRVKDLDELNELITYRLRKIDGVGATQTMMVLKESNHKPLV